MSMSVKKKFFLYLGYVLGKGFFNRIDMSDYDAELHHPNHDNDSWDIYLYIEKGKVCAQFSDSAGWIPYSGEVNSLEHLEDLLEKYYWLKKYNGRCGGTKKVERRMIPPTLR